VTLRPAVAVLVLLLWPAAVPAASIDCARAAGPSEKAICADRPLVRLDAEVAREFSRLLEDVSEAAGTAASPAVAALRDSQRAWLRQRDACGADAGCLAREYRRRLAVFARKPDGGVPLSVDAYVGQFGDPDADPAVTIGVMRGPGNDLLALVEAAGDDTACRIVGIGRLDGQGRLTVMVEPGPGPGPGIDPAMTIEATPSGVTIPPSAVAAAACGRVDLAGDYPRQGAGRPGLVVPDGGLRLDLITDFGPVTLALDLERRTVAGFYPDYRGRIVGALTEDGRGITGEWFQPAGDGPCATARHGTMHWGRLVFTYPDRPVAGDRMTGRWSYCDAAPSRPWNGQFDDGP